jgi:peptide/nickel transport system ATP-binding protein
LSVSTDGRENILEVSGLKTYFFTEDGVVKAVDGVDFEVKRGEILGLVGESGCGKSVTSFSIMRLIGMPGRIVDGSVTFDGQNLLGLPESEMTHIRGNRISMIFQQPTGCLNPVFKVGDQISEVLDIHQSLGREAGWERAIELMQMVGIPEPEKRAHAYPHELSGGQAQRVMIAMALACIPELLIADEPTTALDVTIQAQILDLMRDLQAQMGMAIMYITHDLGVVAETCDDVIVMYLGKVVEEADIDAVFHDPKHPYTRALLKSIPKITSAAKERLEPIEGIVPDPYTRIPGCPFWPRCPDFMPGTCDEDEPDNVALEGDHHVRCHLYS